ncbi:MAG: hypothetical protein P4L27_02315, partial [Ignavibacteriaceae bacterium]|nr:hypothetical protein [Ignavibacteriaceae bacterium]
MKYWYYFLILLFHTPFALYAQNVYPHISELNGMEDYNGITNLLYRISSSQVDSFNSNYSNDIYLLNTVNHIDSLFQIDGSYYNIYLEGGWRIVNSFDFWEKNPRKFIVCGSSGGVDGSAFVERFDGISGLFQFWTNDGDFIRISHQNDSLVYCTIDSRFLFKSTTGGASWDTAGYLNAFSLSPFNDQVLFSTENGILNKTTDGGLNKQVV